MTASNSCNIPAIGPISNTANGTYSSSYNKFYQPGYANIGISLSGTTLTVQSENATSFSSTNPGFIALQSLANPGQIKRYNVTANQTLTQAGLGNSLFGVTSGVNITVDMPFYLYAVSNANNGENAITFMISRIPHRTVAPVAANIGQSGNTNATTQGSFYALATITATDYASSPCLCIGSFRMRYSSSLWTVQTLNNSDGIGQFNDQTLFNFPVGQFGANTSNYFTTANAPTFSPVTYSYMVSKNGNLTGYNSFGSSTNGTNASQLTMAIPFVSLGNAFAYGNSLVSGVYSSLAIQISSSTGFFNYTNNGGTGVLLNNSMTNGSTLVGTFNTPISTA